MLKEYKDEEFHYFKDENGLIQGEYKEWWSNGIMAMHCFYVDDMLHGEYKYWHTNGRIGAHYFFVDDEKQGEFKSWNLEGKLNEHCFYIGGVETSFDKIPYPETELARMYFKLKYDLQLIENS